MIPSTALHPVQQAGVDAFSPATRHDPYPAYDVLRAAGPFVPGPHGTQLVTRHADCEAILADPSWSHAEEPALLHPDSDVELPGSFLWLEPPDHTRLRSLGSAAFTPRRIEQMRARAGAAGRRVARHRARGRRGRPDRVAGLPAAADHGL